MIVRRIAHGLVGEAAPGGHYAVSVNGQPIETDAGPVATPGENILYLRALWRDGTRWLIGGGHQTDIAWQHDSIGWDKVGFAYGVNPCAFEPAASLWCHGGHACTRLPLDGGLPTAFALETGSQGIRWVTPDGVIVTADSTYADLSRGLFQFTDYGDVAIGEGADETGGGCVCWFADEGILRRYESGQVRFVRVNRDGDTFAIAMTRQNTREVVLYWTTIAEMRTWPPVDHPEPPDPPVPPDPPIPPAPPEPPMSLDRLVSPNGRFTASLQDDGNFVLYDKGMPYWATNTVQPAPPVPPVGPVTDTWPRFGASYYTSLTDPRLDLPAFFPRLRDAGCDYTRVWLIDAWAVSASGGQGCYDGWMPWDKASDGRFDLWRVSSRYLDRLREYVERANAHGILPQLTGWELYSWSDRKQGALYVPDANHGPFRHNIQGIYYADDSAFERIAQPTGEDAFLWKFYADVVHVLSGLDYSVELGNEMPEKPLHQRLKMAWIQAGVPCSLSVNRQENTPGQHANMQIGKPEGYDRIAFHGKKDIGYLDEVYDDEPVYKTFRQFYGSGPVPATIILSSDGCRKSLDVNDAYDYDALGVVFRDGLARGFSTEHQSCLKLRGFSENRIDVNDLEVDWLRSLKG